MAEPLHGRPNFTLSVVSVMLTSQWPTMCRPRMHRRINNRNLHHSMKNSPTYYFCLLEWNRQRHSSAFFCLNQPHDVLSVLIGAKHCSQPSHPLFALYPPSFVAFDASSDIHDDKGPCYTASSAGVSCRNCGGMRYP